MKPSMVALLGSVVVIAVVVFGILSLAPKDSGVADGLLFTVSGSAGGTQKKTCAATGGTPCPSPTWA